jgi:hypothetical protein
MARPTLYHRPLTAAARMRRYRARKAAGVTKPMTVRELCQRYGISERYHYYVKAIMRNSLITWDDGLDAFLGNHGKIGLEFLAEVCRYGDAAAQTAVRDRIKQSGAAAGKALWRQLMPKHPALKRKYALAKDRKRRRRLGFGRLGNPHLGMVW